MENEKDDQQAGRPFDGLRFAVSKLAPYGTRRRRILTMLRRGEFRWRHMGMDEFLFRVTPGVVQRWYRGSPGWGRLEFWRLKAAAWLVGVRGRAAEASELQPRLARASELLAGGRLMEAEAQLCACLAEDPSCVDAYCRLALLQSARGDYASASRRLFAAWAAGPPRPSPDLLMQLASIQAAMGCIQEANNLLDRILRQFPDHADACMMMADMSMSRARYKEAAMLCGRVLAREPEHPSARALLAECTRPRFGGAAPPAVSIIVPVLDRLECTRRCLQAIREEGYPAVETIVVDNGSRKETVDYLASLQLRRVIRNEANPGFVKACNQGAAAAEGKYLLFLNNDAFVKPGAIGSLVETAEIDPIIGAVGCKILYPSGVLQDAGGIVFRDGTAWNYGKGDDAHKPEFDYVREVSYGSAACLLVRKQAFCRVDGFDERYSPAYFEDTDLAFALRRAGYRVVYQPEAEVIHLEGATGGRATSTGYKSFQPINQVKFKQKWAEELGRQPAYRPRDVRNASNQGARQRILFIDQHLPLFDRSSGENRTFQMLRLMKEDGHDVTFLARDGHYQQRYRRALEQMGVETYATDPARTLSWDREAGARRVEIGSLLKQRQFSLAIVARYEIAEVYLPILHKHMPSLPVVVDSVDVRFLRERRKAALYHGTEDPIRAAETEVYRQSDGVITVTEEDRSVLLGEAGLGNKPVFVIPTIHVPAVDPPPFASRKDLLFVGNFLHPPNSDAMIHFCGTILPLIRRRLPEVRLLIVGANGWLIAGQVRREGVIVTGYVPSILPFLDGCRVSVAPIRYGAGMKGKIGEALAHGLPVVTTPTGAEGFAAVEQHLLVQEEPESFADAVIRLYSQEELWNRLSRESRLHAERHYSPAAVRPLISGLLEAYR